MAAKSHSFSTQSEHDTLFVEALKISERREGRANFSWVVIQALKDYAAKMEVKHGSSDKIASISAS